jgi:hypothetical protein
MVRRKGYPCSVFSGFEPTAFHLPNLASLAKNSVFRSINHTIDGVKGNENKNFVDLPKKTQSINLSLLPP